MKEDFLDYKILNLLSEAKTKKSPCWLSKIHDYIDCSEAAETSLPTLSRRIKALEENRLIEPRIIKEGRINIGYYISTKGEFVLRAWETEIMPDILSSIAQNVATPLKCHNCGKRGTCIEELFNQLNLAEYKKQRILQIIGNDPETLKRASMLLEFDNRINEILKTNRKLKEVLKILFD